MLGSPVEPGFLFVKLDGFIMSLMVGVGPDRLEILIEGLEGSAGNDVL